MSNEHPDMSGSGVDDWPTCHRCGRTFREEHAYGVDSNSELLFCSADCVASWEDGQMERAFGVE